MCMAGGTWNSGHEVVLWCLYFLENKWLGSLHPTSYSSAVDV